MASRAGVALLCSVLLGPGVLALETAAPAGAQQPAPAAPVAIDGPDPAIALPSGLASSVARDGTGGVVYLKQAGGADHVFVSSFVGGQFAAPQQLDLGLSANAAQPVIAAANGGLMVVGFVSGGQLYVVWRTSSSAPFTTPRPLASSASNPAIAITNLGKAYLAFTVADGTGNDVRAAYYYNNRWGLEGAPLNIAPADNAGVGSGRPSVAVAGDGVAVVIWGENGHIVSRRVWATSPSVVAEQADGALPGCGELGADQPVVGTGGDSSYASVVFHETLSCGGAQQSRVLVNRLAASAYGGLGAADGLTSGDGLNATDPQITIGEYGRGLITSARSDTNDVFVTQVGTNDMPGSTSHVNGEPDSVAPDPVPATAGLFSNLVAWQQAPTATGLPGVLVRYAPSGSGLGPEMTVSAGLGSASDAADGLAAAGDVNGDSLIAWVQTAAGGPEIMAARLYQPPGGFAAIASRQYQRTDLPRLSWSAADDPWGPVTYTVSVDGVAVGQTTATFLVVPSARLDGPHTWQATATNPAGQQSAMRPADVFLDTVAPALSVATKPKLELGKRIKLHLTYVDLPPTGESISDASGVARVGIRWGDGSTTKVAVGKRYVLHRYRRARRYTIKTTVTDRAGNATTIRTPVRVTKPGQGSAAPGPGKRTGP